MCVCESGKCRLVGGFRKGPDLVEICMSRAHVANHVFILWVAQDVSFFVWEMVNWGASV